MSAETPETVSFTMQTQFPPNCSVADLQRRLGGVPIERILVVPPPGCATEEDVIRLSDRDNRMCELQDGILVEKPMGWYESVIASLIIFELGMYLRTNDLGKVLAPDGAIRLFPGIIRIPDVSFVSWERWPKAKLPRRPIPAIIPDLVVEVLSDTNTPAEMDSKLTQYFDAGVRLVWYIDPAARAATAYSSANNAMPIEADGYLDGGTVLPGFQLSLTRLFTEADRQGPSAS